MIKYSFPAGYGTACYLVPIDAALVPLIAGALRKFLEPSVWATRGDFEQGYNAFGELYSNMANNCATELIEGQNRLYRLLDTALNGTIYDAPTADPADITPAIPLVPSDELGDAPGLRRQLLDAQGLTPGGWFGVGSEPVTLADVVKALRQGSEDEGESLLDKLDLLGDAGDIGGLFNVVRGTVTDGLALGAEGGMFVAMLVGIMAQTAGLHLQQVLITDMRDRLDRLITSLDGGAEPAPATNVISELEAVNEKLT